MGVWVGDCCGGSGGAAAPLGKKLGVLGSGVSFPFPVVDNMSNNSVLAPYGRRVKN